MSDTARAPRSATLPRSARSPPAQNAGGEPVSAMARTSGSLPASSTASPSRETSSTVSALRRSGRSSRNQRTGPRCSTTSIAASATLPDRRALLGEGRRTLARVLAAEDRRHDLALPPPALLEGPVDARPGDGLGRRDGQRPVLGDRRRQLERTGQRLALTGEPVDQADLRRARRPQRITGEQQLQRQGEGNATRQQHRRTTSRDEGALHLRNAEPGRLRGDDQVAGEQQLETAGQGPALDGADQRLARRRLGDPAQPAPLDRGALTTKEPLEVHAGREHPAGSGEHADAQVVGGVQLVDSGRDPLTDSLVERVLRLRPVDRDDLDAVAPLDQYLVRHGISSE